MLSAAALAAGLAAVPAATASASAPRPTRLERAIVRGIDYQRGRSGLHRVRMSGALDAAADSHSREMLLGNYFAHTSLNGGSFTARLRRFTRSSLVGETLAWVSSCRGPRASHVVMSMWMHSP